MTQAARKQVSLRAETVARLDAMAVVRESYDATINRLLDDRERWQVEATRLIQQAEHDEKMDTGPALELLQDIGPRFSTRAGMSEKHQSATSRGSDDGPA